MAIFSPWIVIFIDFHYVAVKHGFCKIIFHEMQRRFSFCRELWFSLSLHELLFLFFCELWKHQYFLPGKCDLEPRLPPSSVFIVLWVQLRPFGPWNKVIVITGHLPYLMAKTLQDSGSFCQLSCVFTWCLKKKYMNTCLMLVNLAFIFLWKAWHIGFRLDEQLLFILGP